MLKDAGVFNSREMSKFKDWAERIYGVKKLNTRIEGIREWRYMGFRPRTPAERVF